jgi:hypothetical protein
VFDEQLEDTNDQVDMEDERQAEENSEEQVKQRTYFVPACYTLRGYPELTPDAVCLMAAELEELDDLNMLNRQQRHALYLLWHVKYYRYR